MFLNDIGKFIFGKEIESIKKSLIVFIKADISVFIKQTKHKIRLHRKSC